MLRRHMPVLLAVVCGLSTTIAGTPSLHAQQADADGKSAQQGEPVDYTMVGKAAMDRWQRDSHIAVDERGNVTLAPVSYIVDSVGNYISHLSVDGNTIARKRFTHDRPGAAGAEIYVYMGNGEASINGHPLKFAGMSHGMGGWSEADVPAEWLKEGENVITFTRGFRLGYDTDRGEAKFSDVSSDGGKTWQATKGELLVHVRTKGHPAQGRLTSPVLDMSNPADQQVIAPLVKQSDFIVYVPNETPEGAAVDVEVRTGDTPVLTGEWKHVKEGALALKADDASLKDDAIISTPRFVQMRLTLRSERYDTTPVVRGVNLNGTLTTSPGDAVGKVRVISAVNNDPLLMPSQAFGFQPKSANLTQLREQFKLDEVVAAGKTEMEKFILLRNWVRRQWPHNDDGSGVRTWNAIEILTAPAGQKGMCVHYGVTFTQCAVALGYHSRQLILNGHYVSEIWSNEHQKWVLMDVETTNREGWNRYGTAMYIDDRTGVPMNGKDLYTAVHSGDVSYVTQEMYMTAPPPDGKTATEPIGDHVKYQRKYDLAGLKSFSHIGYPDRNNYLDQLDPWEKAHGFDHYHSNTYLWWSGPAKNHTAEYSGFTTRPGDLDWTVNRAHIRLNTTKDADQLAAVIETFTPNLASFRYRLNGEGTWKTLDAPGKGAHRMAAMNWPLGEGVNVLEVKPITTLGTEGIVTRIEVQRQ